ncbi:MAG: adenosine deaminase [Acidimicrobiales bacterium]
MDNFIFGLPKCELHVHLEGTLEAGTAASMAARHGLERNGVARTATFEGLADFLEAYYADMAALRDEADFTELTAQYLGTARRQGVRYAELFFDPQAHTARGVPFDAVVSGIRRAQEDARASGGPDTQLVMCFLRDESVESARSTLAASLPYLARGWILGVGLDSDERGNPPERFAGVYEQARAAGYRLTAHCDPRQESSIAHLWQCLDVLGVERIDHGIECVADPRLCAELVRRGLGLTICPLSNLRLYGTLMTDEIYELMDRGVLVTLNSDDPAYFGGYVADNYEAVAGDLGLSRRELGLLAKNSFDASWLDPERKAAYRDAVDEHVTGWRYR